MKTVIPSELEIKDLHQILVGSVAPRPIALVSTISSDGVPNIAPYSFFNVFGSNPPTAVFSSVRNLRSGTAKDTLVNIEENRECVIHVVSYDIVYQTALASVNYPAEVSEFAKAGFTPIPSEVVKPPRAKESPVHFECKVKDIYSLGDHGGAGSLIICNIERIHLAEHIFDAEGKIDPSKIDLTGRLGRAFYSRSNGDSVFPLLRPRNIMGMGFDGLPDFIKSSTVLTANNLAQLAACDLMPEPDSAIQQDAEVMNALAGNVQDREKRLHLYAKELLDKNEVDKAWQVLMVE
ncbi:MAG: flavin reductase family protein [Bacteroidota bacterium]